MKRVFHPEIFRPNRPRTADLTRLVLTFVGAWIALIMAPGARAEAGVSEHEVKAALLFNLLHFVRWPETTFASADAPFVIAVLGPDPFGRFLDELVAQEKVRGRAVTILRTGAPERAAAAHLVYVSRWESVRLDFVFAALRGKPCLTIGESGRGDFAGRGGMIEFVSDQGKIRLRMNAGAVKGVGLTVSAKLLQLSEIVGPNP